MRLFRSLRALVHFKLANWLLVVSDWQARQGEAVLADIRLRRMCHRFRDGTGSRASRVLLASIVGLAICCTWIWFTARAAG